MKTRFLFLSMIVSNLLFAQVEFAPVGAVWTYDYARHNEYGVEKIACVGDTLIAGESARVLTITRTYFDASQSEDTLVHVFENKYLRQSGDTVLLYHNDAFRLIYNFGAEAPGFDYVPWDDSKHYELLIYNLALTDTLLNGLPVQLHRVVVQCALIDQGHSRHVAIINGIGAIDAHLLYYSDYDCSSELLENFQNTTYQLRCYAVNDELIYTSGASVDCDALTSDITDCSCAPTDYLLYPNPAQDHVYVRGGQGSGRLVIYDIHGRKVFDENLTSNSIALDHLQQGMYYAGFYRKGKVQFQSLIISK